VDTLEREPSKVVGEGNESVTEMEVIQVLADPIVIVTDQVDSLGRESAYMVGELAEPDIVKKECDVRPSLSLSWR
jgi:hypothetical protein